MEVLKLRLPVLILVLFVPIIAIAQDDSKVKVMSYNIRYNNPNDGDNWWELRKEEVISLIDYYEPDIFGVQEALPSQMNYLSNKLEPYEYRGISRDGEGTKGEYAAIFFKSERYEVKNWRTIWLSETPDRISVGWDAALNRVCTYVHLLDKSDQTDWHVFNAHFDHRGVQARIKSAELIIDQIASMGIMKEAIILMGDLNALPDSKPIDVFSKQLDNVRLDQVESIYGPIGTYNSFKLDAKLEGTIDYIFTKNLNTQKYRHIDDHRRNGLWVSDHLPVLVEVTRMD